MADENAASAESGPLSVDAAAARLEGLFSEPAPPAEVDAAPEEEPKPEEAPAETDGDDAEADEATADAEPEDGEEEPEEADDEDASDDDEPDDEPEEPETFTVKIDGREVAVSRDELIAGYQATKAAQKRFDEAAEMRKAAEAQHQAAIAQRQEIAKVRDAYLAELQEWESQYAGVREPDWNALAAQARETGDYAELMEKQLAWRQVEADRQKLHQKRQELETQREAEARQAQEQAAKQQAEFVKAEQQRLLERLPMWKDPEKFAADRAEIRSLAKAHYNLPDEELNQIMRADHVLILRDAIQWRKHKAATKKVQKKVASAPPKVAAPKPAAERPTQARERDRAISRLRQTHRVEDAASAILRLG